MSKKCCKCKLIMGASFFCKRKRSKDGLNEECKLYTKTRSDKNKEAKKKYDKEYCTLNSERLSEISKKYREKNKNTIKVKKLAYIRAKEKSDPAFKMIRRLRSRLYKVTRGTVKTGSSVKDLGCSAEQLRVYLESLFKPGMSWDNYSKNGWHVDHIVPLSRFDLTNREEFLKACHYTNLQPLWAEENLKKSNKVGV